MTARFLQWHMNHGLTYFHINHVSKWAMFHFRFEMAHLQKVESISETGMKCCSSRKKVVNINVNGKTLAKAPWRIVWKYCVGFSCGIEATMVCRKGFSVKSVDPVNNDSKNDNDDAKTTAETTITNNNHKKGENQNQKLRK
jgi:hypothetical protein